MPVPEDEGEIGCWLGTPYWGQGIIPEAVKELIRYGFEELGLKRIWYAYFDGNEKSKRVAEKCGFRYHHTNRDLEWKLLNKTVTEHVYVLEKTAGTMKSKEGKSSMEIDVLICKRKGIC